MFAGLGGWRNWVVLEIYDISFRQVYLAAGVKIYFRDRLRTGVRASSFSILRCFGNFIIPKILSFGLFGTW